MYMPFPSIYTLKMHHFQTLINVSATANFCVCNQKLQNFTVAKILCYIKVISVTNLKDYPIS